MFKKSQSSFEFITIFGIGLVLIVIISGIFFSYSGSAKTSIDQSQINKIGKEIISSIEKVYFMGEGNRITYEVSFPVGIENISIHHINNSNSTNDIYFDYLNISYIGEGQIKSYIFTTSANYIRFNCSDCYHSPIIGGNGTSYFNKTYQISSGLKTIRIESEGSYVNMMFVDSID